MQRRNGGALTAAVIIMMLASAGLLPAQALGEPKLKVTLTINRIETIESHHENTPDYYAKVELGGTNFRTSTISGRTITPGWEFSKELSASQSTLNVAIALFDADSGLRGGDDAMDITSRAGKELNLRIGLSPCSIEGRGNDEGYGPLSCGVRHTSTGTSDINKAKLFYTVRVEAPAAVEDRRISCIHRPLWPKPGETVTIVATAMRADIFATNSVIAANADAVEIWTAGSAIPARTCNSASSCTHVATASAGTDFSYACKATSGAIEVWTGWRTASVGDSSAIGDVVPIMYTGPARSRLDVVFVADRDDYPSANSAAFLADVANMIVDGYFTEEIILANQDQLNFWIMKSMGDARGNTETCKSFDVPANFVALAMMDVIAIIHTAAFRDCGYPDTGVMSAEVGDARVLVHESGHAAFGLSDEYSDATTYHFENWPLPNVYANRSACEADAPSVGAAKSDCRELIGRVHSFSNKWYTSDPAPGTGGADLMNNNRTAQRLDRRRIHYIFKQCAMGGC